MSAFLSPPFIHFTHSLDKCTNPCYLLWQCVCVSESIRVPLWAHWGEFEVSAEHVSSMYLWFLCSPSVSFPSLSNSYVYEYPSIDIRILSRRDSCRIYSIRRTKFKAHRDTKCTKHHAVCVSFGVIPFVLSASLIFLTNSLVWQVFWNCFETKKIDKFTDMVHYQKS